MADPGNSDRPEMAGGTLVSRFGRENQSTADGNGANDSVKRREAEQIVVALRDSGFPAEYSLAPDEGNGFIRLANNLAVFIGVEKFPAKHLDGCYRKNARLRYRRV